MAELVAQVATLENQVATLEEKVANKNKLLQILLPAVHMPLDNFISCLGERGGDHPLMLVEGPPPQVQEECPHQLVQEKSPLVRVVEDVDDEVVKRVLGGRAKANQVRNIQNRNQHLLYLFLDIQVTKKQELFDK